MSDNTSGPPPAGTGANWLRWAGGIALATAAVAVLGLIWHYWPSRSAPPPPRPRRDRLASD